MKKLMIASFMSLGVIIPLINQQPPIKYSDSVEFRSARNLLDERELKLEELEIQKLLELKLEQERMVQEELERQREEEEKNRIEWIEFELTFYTSLPSENGGYTVTCLGEELQYGMVANNVLDLGTEIYLDGWGTFTNSDRGGSNFNTVNRLDVLIERNHGENDSEYSRRVNNMGKVKVMGYIIE